MPSYAASTGLKFTSIGQSINIINNVIMNLTLRITTKQLGYESAAEKGPEKCLSLGSNKKQSNGNFHQIWAKALQKIRQDTNSIVLHLFQDMDFLYLPH